MTSRLILAVVSAFAISLLYVGAGEAARCTPHCAPDNSNQGGELRGLDRANSVAGDNGAQGRANAAAKQGIVPTPDPVPTPVPTPPPDADGDGITDSQDQCPNEAGPAPSGCPAPLPPPGS